MRILKRLLLSLILLAIFIAGSSAAYIYHKQDDFEQRIIQEVNKQLKSPIEIGDIEFSAIKNFPLELVKPINEVLNVKIDSLFDIKKNIELSVLTSSIDTLKLKGSLELSDSNDFLFNNFYISNNDNVDIYINGSLKSRKLVGTIKGKNIDLSKNVIRINDEIKDYYFQSENYNISTKRALLIDGLLVDDLNIIIDKKKNKINVQSNGNTGDTSFKYVRTKDTKIDVSVIDVGNIINSVGSNHSARNIISKGKAVIRSHRIIGSLETNVDIDLEDFVLINTPSTLKLLSMPSFSGLSSALNNEAGI